MNKVLVLDNYDSFTYNLVHYIEDITSVKPDVIRNDEIPLEQISVYDKIILSPGPGLPKDAGILKETIQTYASTKIILGVCLGMQAIGEVFGGKLHNLDKVFHGVSTPMNVVCPDDALFKGIPNGFMAGRYHSWVIDKSDFPNILEITCEDEFENIMAIKHKELNVYGVQFHPESILTEHGKKIIQNFLSI